MRRILAAILLVLLVFTITYSITDAASAERKQPTRSNQLKNANFIMDTAKNMANVYEEGDHLVIEFYDYVYPYDVNKRLQFVRAIANADAVICGKSRNIYYYNPGGKKMAQADMLSGIRLIDE